MTLGTFLRMYIDEHDGARVCACASEIELYIKGIECELRPQWRR